MNAFRHGNRGAPGKVVQFRCDINHERAEFEVRDEGEGFDPSGVPDPTADENLEIPSGRGLMLMRAYMSEVEHVPPGNALRMVYKMGQIQRIECARSRRGAACRATRRHFE